MYDEIRIYNPEDMEAAEMGAMDVEETVEVIEYEQARPFLETPLNDYSVTEGLLLFIAFALALFAVVWVTKEVF